VTAGAARTAGAGRPARLCDAALAGLPADVRRPGYPRAGVAIGVVHLGVGNFHRAHQAIAFDDLLVAGDLRWGVCGVSLRSAATREALGPQDGLYALLERDGGGTRVRVPGALRELLLAPAQRAAAIARLADPAVRAVTLTITEKGYDDLGPSGAIALLRDGLAARRAAGAGGLTLLSCDNLAGNGRRLRERLLQAAAADATLAAWLEREAACPDTMVDRIVPATVDADRAEAAARLGCADAWPVACEPFSQWVVEARFAGETPPLERVGVRVVADVAPWEAMKLRMLNAAHTALAMLGAPAGIATVDAAIAEPRLAAFVDRLWTQVAATLPASVRAEAPAYAARLRERFANPALRHRLLQIAQDTSRKLPQRLVATVDDAAAAGRPYDAALLAIAGWMRFCAGADGRDGELPLDDPLAARLRPLARTPGDAHGAVHAMLALPEVFPAHWARDARRADALAAALGALRARGLDALGARAEPAR
jgi:fructuronate reductase